MLQGGGHDEVAAAAQHAARLRPADRLAAGECHEVGAFGDEASEIGLRRQLRRGIDQHRDPGGMGHADDFGQRRAGEAVSHVEDRRGARRDRVGDLPRLGIADPGAGIAIGQADLDQPHAGGTHRMIIEIALAAHDDDLVLHPRRVGQARHQRRLEAGDAGGRAQQQAGGCAGSDVSGLRPGRRGDRRRRLGLEFGDVDAMLRRLGHGRGDLDPHDPAGEARRRTLGVDRGAQAEPLIDVHRAPQSTGSKGPSPAACRSRQARPKSVGGRAGARTWTSPRPSRRASSRLP